MAIIQIPITQEQSQLQSFIILVALAGNNYYLQFDWIYQSQNYLVSISDSNNNPLLMGIPMVVNYDLTSRFKIPGLFTGVLMLFDSSNSQQEANFGDLGQRCLLIYQETAES